MPFASATQSARQSKVARSASRKHSSVHAGASGNCFTVRYKFRGGAPRARPHCRLAPPPVRFTPESLTYSVSLFLKRQRGGAQTSCRRRCTTWTGWPRSSGGGRPARPRWRALALPGTMAAGVASPLPKRPGTEGRRPRQCPAIANRTAGPPGAPRPRLWTRVQWALTGHPPHRRRPQRQPGGRPPSPCRKTLMADSLKVQPARL